MSTQPQRPAWTIALALTLGLGAALGGALLARRALERPPAVPVTRVAAVYASARPLPEFALTDDDGHPATRAVFSGHWSLVFFGYTHCPDACPATLAQLRVLDARLASLPPALRPTVFLVSVDPQRDPVDLLHAYVRFFGPGFRGLTGDPAASEAFTRALGIAVVVRNSASADYTVDHSAAILVVDPHADLRALFPAPHNVEVLDADYRTIVAWAGADGRGRSP